MRRFSVAGAAALVTALALVGSGAFASSGVGANGSIVFSRGGTIYVLSSGTATSTTVSGTDPQYSPDGTKLAFTTGGNVKTCTGTASSCSGSVSAALQAGSQPAWSPDGTKIAYTAANGIHVMTSSGGSDALVNGSAAGDAHPTWSPDGTKIAFDRSGQIWLMNSAAPYQPHVLIAAPSFVGSWSPDGLSIAYQATSGGHSQIFVIPASGGTSTQVDATSTDESAPSWSPDGTSIVFADSTSGLVSVKGSGSTWTATTASGSAAGDATPDWQTVVPVAVTAPTITGGTSPSTSVALTATNGTWTGAKSTGYTYQWQRCDSSGNSCSSIGGATLVTYTPGTADVGHTLRVVVTASNTAGTTASSPSAATGIVVTFGTVLLPANTVYPTVTVVSGDPNPAVGDQLTATTGTWTGTSPITYTYAWLRCDATDPVNGACYTLAGATSSTLTIPPEAWKYRIRVQVTATNSGGSVSQFSVTTVPIRGVAPVLNTAGGITGTAQVGQTLTVSGMSWSGAPIPTVAYDWRRCDGQGTPSSCVSIPGGTSSSYVPKPNDIGHALRVFLTGTNIVGSTTGYTVHTFPVIDRQHFAPSTTTAPAISGIPVVGGGVAATVGVYGGDTPLDVHVQWQRCDAVGDTCRGIRGAFRLAYTPAEADVGSTLRVAVSVKNGYGSLIALSGVTDPVQGLPPHRVGRRIVGTKNSHFLLGTAYDDVIVAGPGNVTIDGKGGNDNIHAGSGKDVIWLRGPGTGHVYGGTGSATIYAANGYRDYITCRGTHDRVVADAFDVVVGCAVLEIGEPGATSGTPVVQATGTAASTPKQTAPPKKKKKARKR